MTTITLRDRTTDGSPDASWTLDFLTERVTLRELIRARVYQEVSEHNARRAGLFRGLVLPDEPMSCPPEASPPQPPRINWERQATRATEAVATRRVIVMIDDVQVDDLDSVIHLTTATEVTFVKLVPLAGG